MTRHSRCGGDRGETLVETLISIVILGIAGAAILGGVLASAKASDYHRRQATGETLVRAAAEQVKAAPYKPCPATAVDYPMSAPGAGYTVSVVSVEYWTGLANPPNTFQSSCVAAGDQGLQRVTIRLAANDGRDTETLAILKRRGN